MKRAVYILPLLVVAVFIFSASFSSPLQAGSSTTDTAASSFTPVGVMPDPALNGNVTWSNYYSNYTSPLEYNNGIANSTLNASLSLYKKNPITINPTDIIAPGVLQNDKVAGKYWNSSTFSYQTSTSHVNAQIGRSTSNGYVDYYIHANTTSSSSGYANIIFYLDWSNLLSNNLQFNYFTTAFKLTADSQAVTGTHAYLFVGNSTGNNVYLSQNNGTLTI